MAFALLGVFIAGLAGALTGILSSSTSTIEDVALQASKVGIFVVMSYYLIISGFLFREKRLYKNFAYVLLAVLNIVLVFFGGVILGLILPAFLTTRDSGK